MMFDRRDGRVVSAVGTVSRRAALTTCSGVSKDPWFDSRCECRSGECKRSLAMHGGESAAGGHFAADIFGRGALAQDTSALRFEWTCPQTRTPRVG